jgi:putative redox protein
MKIKEPYKKIPKVVEASLEWNGRMGFVCRSGSGHELLSDASAPHGGDNSGARPMELLLFALGGCTGMDVATILKKKRLDLQGLKIKTHGQRAPNHPHVYENITLEYILTGSDLRDNDVRWAIELSLNKYCSVAGMLQKICKLNYRWRIISSAPRETS